MKKSLSAVALLAFAICLPVDAEDWTQYRGPNSSGKSVEQIPEAGSWKVQWKAPTPLGFSSFSIANGRAFTIVSRDVGEGLREQCIALDAQTGKELWAFTLGSGEYEQGGGNAGARDNRGGDGPRSTPTTDGTNVYVYDSHMTLVCLNAKDGRQVWGHDVVSDYEGRNIKWLNATSPVMSGDKIFVVGGGPGKSFLAFNKKNGKLIWSSGDETMTHATPTPATIDGKKQFVCFMQAGLIGIEQSTGKELWRCEYPFSVSSGASAVVEGNKVYCSAGYGVGAGLFEVTEKAEADEVWFKANELMNHWSTPVVHQGHLYGLYEFKKYGRAPLQCVELATGKIKWSEYGFGPGNCILADGKLIVLSDAGDVVIADANPDKYIERSRIEAIDGKCWSTPSLANGKIYVRSTAEAACLVPAL